MNLGWLCPVLTRRKRRREREKEAKYRDERSDRMLAELQDRKRVAEGVLQDRQRRNHWQEAISEMIQAGRA